MQYLYFTLAIYASVALILGLGLWFFLYMRRRINALEQALKDLEQSKRESSVTAGTLEARRNEFDGKPAEAIASALGVSAAEVKLAQKLVKTPAKFLEVRA